MARPTHPAPGGHCARRSDQTEVAAVYRSMPTDARNHKPAYIRTRWRSANDVRGRLLLEASPHGRLAVDGNFVMRLRAFLAGRTANAGDDRLWPGQWYWKGTKTMRTELPI